MKTKIITKETSDSSDSDGVKQPLPVDLKTGLTVGDFTLIKPIGSGGMGEVWLAEQPAMGREVALKILSPSLTGNKNFVSRFLKEVKTSAKLNHPNIVTAFHAGVDKGVYYLAISYVDGMALGEYLEIKKIISEKESLTICKKIAYSLKYAWNKFKIIHRDIKPSNIMIEKEGNEPHLMDMGISKSTLESNELTLTGTIVGTPYYMSPEQARMEDSVDCRSDIYSLGATLYHIMVGDVPYDSQNAIGILSKLISDPFPNPQEKNPDLSDNSSMLLEKMMSKDPAKRQQTWDEVINDIDEVLRGSKPGSTSTGASKTNAGATQKKVALFEEQATTIIKPSASSPNKKSGGDTGNSKNLRPGQGDELTCPHCGAPNNQEARFCMGCGKNISKKCPECDVEIPVNIKYCSKCGTDLARMVELEKILKELRVLKQKCDWSAIAETKVSFKDRTKLSGKISKKLIGEIEKIQREAESFLRTEKAYETTNALATKLTQENKPFEAYSVLQKFLADNLKSEYASEIKFRLKKLKKISYNGPVAGESWTVPDLELSLQPINPGEFTMGSYPGNFFGIGKEDERQKNEGPLHDVTISKPFWMAACATTISQYLMFYDSPETPRETLWTSDKCPSIKAGKDASISNGCWGSPDHPMIDVNHVNADEFCKWLTTTEIKNNRLPDGYLYRLPTEAEWEYCCRAGATTRFSFGNDEKQLDEFAWHSHNSDMRSHPVGEKSPNPWGLFDMHGNVWEWCFDKYADYTSDGVVDPYAAVSGRDYVRRGGSWINGVKHCRSAYRNSWDEKCYFEYLGFRIVLAPKIFTIK